MHAHARRLEYPSEIPAQIRHKRGSLTKASQSSGMRIPVSSALLGVLLVTSMAQLNAFQPSPFLYLEQADGGDSNKLNTCDPREVHLSLTETTSVMRVMWRTSAIDCPSTVSFGERSHQRDESLQLSTGSSFHITEELMCSNPAKHKNFRATVHSALMSGLEAGREYWYAVAGDSSVSNQDERRFTAPRHIGSSDRFSFIALGDMGESNIKGAKSPMAGQTAISMEEEILANPVDLVLHMGDLAYADGKHKVWESFMDTIEPISSRVPYMVGVGNHEYDYRGGEENDPTKSEPYHPAWGNFENDSGGECGVMIARRFTMPASTPAPLHDVQEVAVTAAESAVSRRRGLRLLQESVASTVVSAAAAATPVATAAAATVAAPQAAAADAASTAAAAAGLKSSSSDRSSDSSIDVQEDSSSDGSSEGGDESDPLQHSPPRRDHDDGDSDSGSKPKAMPPFWYSFDVGSVHFTVTSTEHDLTEGSLQRAWLRSDLANVNRCLTPWLVVGLHRPMYVVYPHKDNRIVGEHLLRTLEPLFLEHRVDATISGHVHSYARTCSVIDGVCRTDESGIHHFVMGTGGHNLSGAEDFQQNWCQELIMEHGFGRFTVDDDMMTVQFISSKDRVVRDQIKFRSKVVPGGSECRSQATV